MQIRESAKDIDVYDSVDVLIAGGGIAGCTAAITAARAGARTLLIERNGCLGGVLTSGIIPNIVNAYIDLKGFHHISGIPLEIMQALAKCNGCSQNWSESFSKLVVDEQKLKVVLIELLQKSGVKIWTHVVAASPIMEGNSVKGLFIETKIGRKAVLAKTTIDCTGEADIAAQTGCPLRVTPGTASLAFKMSNVDGDVFCRYFKDHPEEFPVYRDGVRGLDDFVLNWEKYGIFYFPHRGGREWPLVQRAVSAGEYSKTMGKTFGLDMMHLMGLESLHDVAVNSMLWRLPSLSPEDISEAELETQKVCFYIAEFFQKKIPGFSHAHVSQISQDLGIRVSRGIVGVETFDINMLTSTHPVYFDDTIGCRSARPWKDDGNLDHPFDKDNEGQVSVQSVKGQATADGKFVYGHTVDIPYGIILPQNVDNLLVGSGKAVSAVPQTLLRCGVNSMIPAQAAGTAAACAADSGKNVRDVDIRSVQRLLLSQGVFLGSDDRLAKLGLN